MFDHRMRQKRIAVGILLRFAFDPVELEPMSVVKCQHMEEATRAKARFTQILPILRVRECFHSVQEFAVISITDSSFKRAENDLLLTCS
jgi:hypothetical protein